MFRNPLQIIGRAYMRRLLRQQFDAQRFRRTNERPIEYSMVFHWLNRLQPRAVLDVGTGRSAFPALLRTCGFVVTAIDNVQGYWPRGMFNHHWHLLNEDVVHSQLPPEQFDAVTCVSVFEHIADPLGAIAGMHRLLRPGGALILTTPFGMREHRNVYELPGSYGSANPYPCRQSAPADLERWLAAGFALTHHEYWRLFRDSEFWSCGALLRPPERSETPAHLGCFVMTRTTV